MKIFLVCLKHPKFSTVLFNVLINCTFFNALMIVNNIITTIMEIKGKVNTDTINVHKGERFFPHLVEIDVLKLYNIFKIYLPRGIFIWTNLLSYLTQPMN